MLKISTGLENLVSSIKEVKFIPPKSNNRRLKNPKVYGHTELVDSMEIGKIIKLSCPNMEVLNKLRCTLANKEVYNCIKLAIRGTDLYITKLSDRTPRSKKN